MFTGYMKLVQVIACPFQKSGNTVSIFIAEITIPAVLNAFRRTGVPDQQAGQSAGGSFSYDQAVGIEGRRKDKQVSPAVPGFKNVTVCDGTGKDELSFRDTGPGYDFTAFGFYVKGDLQAIFFCNAGRSAP